MSTCKIILAVVGLPGSGKTEIIKYIQQQKGWPNVYFGKVVFDEMALHNLPINEENERKTREELRQNFGMAAPAIKSIPKIKELFKDSSVLVESLYSWEEYLEMKKEFGANFFVLAVFASPKIRTKRMEARKERPLTPAELVSRDYSQIDKLHQAGPIARADFTIINETDLNYVYGQVNKFLDSLNC